MMMLLCAGCRHLAPGEVCAPDAQLDFRLSISELQAWEGRTVWVAAQEQAWRGAMTEQVRGAAGPSSRQAVLLSAVVQQGTVSASCPRSLSQNVQPFWAAFIDVDGDGRCSPPDVGVMRREFAWPPGGFSRTFPSWERLAWSPVGSLVGVDRPDGSKTQFCEDLFGAPAPD